MTVARQCVLGGILLTFLTIRSHAQAPNGFHYVRTDQDPASVLYDSFHQQFFVTVPGKNALDVVSASDGSTVARVYIASPYGLDLSADGTRLYVTSNSSNFGYPSAEGFFVVDTTSLRVVDFIQPTVPLDPIQIFFPNLDTVPRFIAAMSNGKVFYNADQIGVTSSKIFAFDPGTGISTPRPPTGGGNFYDGTIEKSANGERFVVLSGDSAGGDLWTYDSASDGYIAHLRINNKVVYDAIFSPDGTRVLVAGHLLYDQNLNQIADLNPTAGFQNYRGSTFSPDGTKIYIANSYDVTQMTSGGGTVSYSNPVVAVYQTASGTLLGYVAAPQFATSPFNRGIAVSPQGLALLLNDRGFAEMDLSRPNANLPGTVSQGLRYPNIMIPPVGNPSSPSATTVNGAGFRAGASVYFGSKGALSAGVASGNIINAQPPPGNPGPVDITVSFPDGWSTYGPQAYSYGPSVLYQDVNAGDVNGHTTVQLIGYGFDTSSGQPQVTVGGAPATVTNVNLFAGISPFTFPIEYLTFTTPVGSPGFADITVTTGSGSTTIKNGFQYVTHLQIPGVLPAQMALDESRGRLYVADVASGNVKSVDTNTLGVTTLISSPSNPATGLAMTPDRSKLLVISGSGGTLTVFDLNASAVLNIYYPVPGNQPTTLIPNGVVGTSRGTAIVSLADPSTYFGGAVYELDLATGNASKAPVGASCPAIPQALFASTSSGNQIYIASAGAGCVSLWSAVADATVEVGGHEGSIYQLSSTSLGDRALVNSTTYTSTPALSLVTTAAPNDLLVGKRYLVSGGKIHSTGSLAYVPTTKGIEMYDVHHGQMVLSIGIPSGVASTDDGIAINHTGTTMYVAETSGIGIIQLAAAPLSVGNLLPAQGNSSGGSSVTLLGSGFANGATVSLDGQLASTQFVDSTRLTFVTPPTSAAKVSITVSNPGGDTYALDAAYDASVHQSTPVPVLTALSPAAIQPRSGQANLTISGSGFVSTSQVMLNGQPVQTLYLSGQQIVAYLYDVQGPGLQAITVMNSAPGGGTSNVLELQVTDANPTIINLNPSSIPAGSAAFELNVFGNGNFSPDSVVLWNGSQRPTLYVVAGELIANISANDVAVQGTVSVTVNSPSAANPMSNAVQFTIKPQVPAANVQPLSLTFNPQVIGTKSAAATVTLTSAGQLPLTIGSIALADSADFNQTNNCPPSLSPGQTCNIQVAFAPAVSAPLGPMLSKLTISDNSSASPETVNLAASAADYQVQLGTSSATITAGQSATIALTVKSLGDTLVDRVQLSCSGLPTGATCNFNPSTVIPNLGGIPVTLTISTTGRTSALLFASTNFLWAGLPYLFLLGRRAFRRDRRIILAAILLAVGFSVIACGGSSSSSPAPPNPNQTPPGTYSITITAADGSVQRTTTFNLTVTGS
jgi:sugar lactone lactonase YvrE